MPASRSRRSGRSSEVVDRLERSRAKIKQRRIRAREREALITAAVKRYLAEWEAIATCEATRDQNVAALQQQITRIEAHAAEQITGHHAEQAAAAAVIRDNVSSDGEVAELLEISAKQVRHLITAARSNTTEAAVPSKAAELPGIPAQQLSPQHRRTDSSDQTDASGTHPGPVQDGDNS